VGAVPVERRRKTFADYQTFVGMLKRAGVPILVGSDSPNHHIAPGASLHQEMEFLAASGMSAGEVLAAATLGNARALKAEDRFGSVEPGWSADLVLLEADPLVAISNSRRISVVVRAGVIVPLTAGVPS
jgi:imidazolonepropionase-like amidohydrolase